MRHWPGLTSRAARNLGLTPARARAAPSRHLKAAPLGGHRGHCTLDMRKRNEYHHEESDVMSMTDRPAGQPERRGSRRLTRSSTDRKIAGVCGGFAAIQRH